MNPGQDSLDALRLVRLPPVMALTQGRADIVIGLLDGPVDANHSDLATDHIVTIDETGRSMSCVDGHGPACRHGTFTAGILSAIRGSIAPAICPGCTLLVRPIFDDVESGNEVPSAH